MNCEKINELFSYGVAIRRQLHQCPEVGFDLPQTVKIVTAELDEMGVEYTTKYGTCSIVADIGQGKDLVALRADMDALPVEEQTDLPFKSKNPGKMHACGHDAHTAILLSVAKYLKSIEPELPCRVRLIFQPSEEGAVSGAKMMVSKGVMNGVSHILCTHCENSLSSGKLGVLKGYYMAACVPITIRFFGKSSHATCPKNGIDAVAMAVEAYNLMKEAVTQEASDTAYIWSVGRFSGGFVHNVIADLCELDISFRFYDMDFANRVESKVREICNSVSKRFGGKCEIVWNISTSAVYNDEAVVSRFKKAISKAGIVLETVNKKMISEDFAWYLTKVPGMLFRFGTRNESLGCTTTLHNNDFCIDEEGMKTAIMAFCTYITNYGKE